MLESREPGKRTENKVREVTHGAEVGGDLTVLVRTLALILSEWDSDWMLLSHKVMWSD